MVLEKTLESPLDSYQSILKEISLGCSLEGLMLKLKLQYFGHLMPRADSFEKTLMLGKIEGGRRGWQRNKTPSCIKGDEKIFTKWYGFVIHHLKNLLCNQVGGLAVKSDAVVGVVHPY